MNHGFMNIRATQMETIKCFHSELEMLFANQSILTTFSRGKILMERRPTPPYSSHRRQPYAHFRLH